MELQPDQTANEINIGCTYSGSNLSNQTKSHETILSNGKFRLGSVELFTVGTRQFIFRLKFFNSWKPRPRPVSVDTEARQTRQLLFMLCILNSLLYVQLVQVLIYRASALVNRSNMYYIVQYRLVILEHLRQSIDQTCTILFSTAQSCKIRTTVLQLLVLSGQVLYSPACLVIQSNPVQPVSVFMNIVL